MLNAFLFKTLHVYLIKTQVLHCISGLFILMQTDKIHNHLKISTSIGF